MNLTTYILYDLFLFVVPTLLHADDFMYLLIRHGKDQLLRRRAFLA